MICLVRACLTLIICCRHVVAAYDEKQAEKRQDIATRCIFAPSTSQPPPSQQQQLALTSATAAAAAPETPSAADVAGAGSSRQLLDKQLKVAATKKKLGLKSVTSAFRADKPGEAKAKSFSGALAKTQLVRKTSTKAESSRNTVYEATVVDDHDVNNSLDNAVVMTTAQPELTSDEIGTSSDVAVTAPSSSSSSSSSSNDADVVRTQTTQSSVGLNALMSTYDTSSDDDTAD